MDAEIQLFETGTRISMEVVLSIVAVSVLLIGPKVRGMLIYHLEEEQ
jgi:hypothetical protein